MSSSAERFIEELAKREALPESVIKRLWDKVADSSSVPPARALAQFLVDKGHLTREQADQALDASKPIRKPKKPPEPKPAEVEIDVSVIAEDPNEAMADAIKGRDPKDAKRKKGKKKYVKKTRGENEFDTPLMLLGGGGLVVLVLCVAGIIWLLFSESGDERLLTARTAFEAGSYTQAIQDYELFLEKFSRHEGRSIARVTLGIARIRQALETNPELRLEIAKREIKAIESEEEFPTAQEDLASLLPGIAKGLSEKADAAESLEEIEKYVKLTEEALVLCANSKYLPSRLRDEAEIDRIDELLARIGQRQVALGALEETIATMKQAIASGDTRTAYASHAQFTKAHPEKAADVELAATVAATSEAEQAGIKFVEEPIKAKTTEAKTSVKAAVAMADRRRTAEAPAEGVTVVRYQGGAYAFNRRDGRLLWRRPLGATLERVEPVVIGSDCLLVDSARQEILRVGAVTNKLVWRTPLEDDIAQPVMLGDRILAAGKSGKLHVLDANKGDRIGYVQFAQALQSAPVVYSKLDRVFLVGDHSSVYSLDAKNLGCLGVFYLGHAVGTVVSPPAVVLNRVLVLENDGAATSSLHIFGLDENGVIKNKLNANETPGSRLPGLVTRTPKVFGKRFVVMTESGHIGVYEASSEEDTAALTLLAERGSRRRLRSTPYAAISNQQLWVAGSGLSRYSIQPSGSRLPVREVKEPFRGDTFVHPLRVADKVVIHVRRRRGRAGATVGATDLQTGDVYWETDIAVPAAGAPVSAANGGGLLHATAGGNVFLVDQAAVRSGVADKVIGEIGAGPSTEAIHFDAGQASAGAGVYGSTNSGFAVGVSASGGASEVHLLRLPGPLAGPPTRFADGWLAASPVGQVLYFDGRSGRPLAAPFQPELSPRATLDWRPPGIASVEGKPIAFFTDGRANLYALEVIQSPPVSFISPRAQHILQEGRFASRVAVVGDRVAVATLDDKLKFFSTDTLELIDEVQLGTGLVWGPYPAGERVVAAVADNRLVSYSASTPVDSSWAVELESASLAGKPRIDGDNLLLTMHTGVLELRLLQSGEIVARSEMGQTLAAGATVLGKDLLVAASDGALLFVEPPRRR